MMGPLLQSIPRGLFEPIAILAVLGMVLSLCAREKNLREYAWIFFGVCIFMLFWRSVFQISSRRYAVLLTLPALFYTVYGLFRLPELAVFHHIDEKIRILLPHLLLCGLVVVCLGKDLRFNRHARCILECADAMKTDMVSPSDSAFFSDEPDIKRNEYYTGVKGIPIPVDPAAGRETPRKLAEVLRQYRLFAGRIYVYWKNSRGEPTLTAEEMGVAPEEWTLLKSVWRNNQEKKELRLYRFCSHSAENFRLQVERLPEKKIPDNGDFELVSEVPPNVRADLIRRQLAGADRFGWKIPSGWGVNTAHGADIRGNASIGSVWEDPLRGKASLGFYSDGATLAVCRANLYPATPHHLTFYVRGEAGTHLDISLYLYRRNGTYLRTLTLSALQIPDDLLRYYQLTTNFTEYPDVSSFRVAFSIRHGKATLDDFLIHPLTEKNDRP